MDKKQTLLYVSNESFLDVDFTLLKEMEKYFSIEWYFLLLQNNNLGFFEMNYIREYSLKHNININIFINSNRYRSVKTFWFYCKVLLKARKINTDIIYIEALGYPYLPIAAYFFLPIKKIVFGIHDFKMLLGEKNKDIKNLISKIKFNLFENYHFFSQSQENIFRKYYHNKNAFNTPLLLKDFGEPENKMQLRLNDSKINILFFGRITEYKGLDILLNEFNMLQEVIRIKYHLTIWGACDHASKYKNLIKYPEDMSIKFFLAPNEIIPDLFTQHDLIILPYKDVAQSGVLLIALNYCLPAICSNLEGFKEIVNAEKAFLFFDPNIEGDLCRVLTEVSNLGKGYIKHLKRFIADNVKENYKPSLNVKIMAENLQRIILNNNEI